MEKFNALDAILHELGLTRVEFEQSERHRLELSPREWMAEQLATLGYMPIADLPTLVAAINSKDAA